jgi:hypothetical protein
VLLATYFKGFVTNENSNTYCFFFFPVPKQPNFCDCGVYVCQYALSMFHLRFFSFTYEHVYLSTPPLSVVSNSVPFAFDHGTIIQLRSTMKKILLTLSGVYHRVQVIEDSPKDTSLEATAVTEKFEESATVCKENLFCKAVSSGNEPPQPLHYHQSQHSEQQGLSQDSTQPKEGSPHQKPLLSVKSAKEAVLEAMK